MKGFVHWSAVWVASTRDLTTQECLAVSTRPYIYGCFSSIGKQEVSDLEAFSGCTVIVFDIDDIEGGFGKIIWIKLES